MNKERRSHYVYMIECVNGSGYTGYTTQVQRRYAEHQKGTLKCRYTRSFPPRSLVAVWEFQCKSDALKTEAEIKTMSKKEKQQLILNQNKNRPIHPNLTE